MAECIAKTGSKALWIIALLHASSAIQAQDALSNAGLQNSACGPGALYSNTTGIDNTATGAQALSSNSSGSANIAIGQGAGMSLTTGSFNIDIGSSGTIGESRTIRIGTPASQSTTFIAGIYGTPLQGNPVTVDANGQLGVLVSSERFKTDIRAMPALSDKLAQLRPASFRLKADKSGQTQYGLIAEEVEKILPELVVTDDSGRPDGVRYDELSALLLKELQMQQAQLAAQASQLAVLQKRVDEMKGSLLPRAVSAIPRSY